MADDLLERILQEVRQRQEAARAAYEESRRLEAALDALGPPTPGAATGDGDLDAGAGPGADGNGEPGAKASP